MEDRDMIEAIKILEMLVREHTLELLHCLQEGQGVDGVTVLARKLGLPQTDLSHLISKLSFAGYLECDRDGRRRIYSISKRLRNEVQTLCSVLSHLVEEK